MEHLPEVLLHRIYDYCSISTLIQWNIVYNSMNWHWILYNRVSVLQNPLNPQWVKRVLVHAHSVRDSLITRAIESSSKDRSEESILNTLYESDCYRRLLQDIDPIQEGVEFSSQESILDQPNERNISNRLGIHQSWCGCAFGDACYWSSAANDCKESNEVLVYEMDNNLVTIAEISITVYQAYWHPEAPTYSPRRFYAQIVSKDGLEYRTKEYSFKRKNMTKERFTLDKPLLVYGKAKVFIHLIGKVQMQTLLPNNDSNTTKLYYSCISHIEILGHHHNSFLFKKVHI